MKNFAELRASKAGIEQPSILARCENTHGLETLCEFLLKDGYRVQFRVKHFAADVWSVWEDFTKTSTYLPDRVSELRMNPI